MKKNYNKKLKIKKASDGIDFVEGVDPTKGKLTKENATAAGIGMATAGASIAGDALTEGAVQNKWGKVNKNKAIAGSALSYGAKGAQMGAVAGPWGAAIGGGIGLIGGGIAGSIGANKANKAAEVARLGEKNDDFNQTLTASTINQAKQFKKGGKVKSYKTGGTIGPKDKKRAVDESNPHQVIPFIGKPKRKVEDAAAKATLNVISPLGHHMDKISTIPQDLLSEYYAKDLDWKDGVRTIGELGAEVVAGKLANNKVTKILGKGIKSAGSTFGRGFGVLPPHYKKGGTTNQQVIEIEGKTTPEIHTDKNFNLKNLGSTPHSKGGDKVLAEEGDVVFPTQNSKAKYNKIMKALREKDIPTLKGEQAKLPSDSGKKYRNGVNSIETETEEERRARVKKERAGEQAPVKDKKKEAEERAAEAKRRKEKGLLNSIEEYLFGSSDNEEPTNTTPTEDNKKEDKPPVVKEEAPVVVQPVKTIKKDTTPAKTPLKRDPVVEAIQKSNGLTGKKVDGISGGETWEAIRKTLKTNNSKYTQPTEEQILKDLDLTTKVKDKDQDKIDFGKRFEEYNRLVSDGKATKLLTPEEYISKNPPKDEPEKVGYGAALDTAMELAPIASNLGKGLFGKVDKVERNYLTPELEKYTDLSANARAKSSQMYNAQKSNARNTAGGSIANMRSNMQQSANDEAIRQSDINIQEAGRQTDINARNNQLLNNAKGINLDLKNKYNEIDAASKGAKSGLLSAGLTGLSELGTRNKIERNERDAQKTELDLFAQNTVYTFKDGKSLTLDQIKALSTPEKKARVQEMKENKGKK
jgi:hypothetical protein